ncbi:MAG: tetratricopeptide repeat protein [Methylococcaceae bacterium]
MQTFRLFSVVAIALLAGCNGPSNKINVQDTPEAVESDKLIGKHVGGKNNQVEAAIDPDILYILLTAELAGQRGQYDVALEGYMEAARLSHDPKFAERALKIAIYVKDGNKTNEAIALWLQQEPNNLTVRKIAMLAALRAGKKVDAIEDAKLLIEQDPAGFEGAMLELATVMEKEGRVSELYDVLETLSLQKPNQASIYYLQAVLAKQQKNNDLADSKIQQALLLHPDWDKALIFQAQSAAIAGDLEKAAAILKNAAGKHPDNIKIKRFLAQVLIRSKEFEQASEIYKQLLADNPKDGESQIALALVYLELGRESKAEDLFKKTIDLPEWQAQAYFYLGKIEEKRKDTKKAVQWFDKVSDGPFVFDAAISAISLLVKNKQYDEVEARLNALQSQFPQQKLRIMLMQVEIYNQLKQYDKAYAVASEALALEPDQRDLLYTRALTADRVGKKAVLEEDLKKILDKNPDDPEALNALGYSLLDNPARYQEAGLYLQRALRLRPEEAVIIDSYGWLLFKEGHPEQALTYLQQAYDKQQENEIAAHIAEVLWALGKKAEAKKIYNEAIKRAPTDEYLLNFQQKILNGAE